MSDLGDKLKELYNAGPPWPVVKVSRQNYDACSNEFPPPPAEADPMRKEMLLLYPPIGMQIFVDEKMPEDEIHIVSYDAEKREFTTRRIINIGGEVKHGGKELAPDG